ncbi:MAG: 4-(cytidine 5'-diphospho)-2-C-methyl-D-erythritol kinase [Acidobacteriota bacterium]
MSDHGILGADAPAKINRELRVGPRRADGYHEIRSRFVTIDLADRIEAEESSRLDLVCEPAGLAGLPTDRSNLAARAALALAETAGREPRVRLRLVKRIPAGAGLGGGSTDAAVTLRLLCRLWKLDVSEAELARLAASLGSDVPFFLVGGEADVGGRGERVEARPDEPSENLVLVVPPFSISTAEVYAAFDRLGGASPLPDRLEIEAGGRFFGPNDLERAVVAVRPEMGAFLESGRRIAAECAVTGSGSAIVLAGANAGGVKELVSRHTGSRAVSCRTLGRVAYRRLVEGVDRPPRA